MKSATVAAFWRQYRKLPADVRQAARSAYRQFSVDPRHPEPALSPTIQRSTVLVRPYFAQSPRRRNRRAGHDYVDLDRRPQHIRPGIPSIDSGFKLTRGGGGATAPVLCGLLR